jgi:hypothetical protein
MKKKNNYPGTPQSIRNTPPTTFAPGVLPGTKPTDLKAITCKKCDEVQERFIAISILRHASPLQTASGQPMIINFNNGFACLKCGAVNEFTIEGVVDENRMTGEDGKKPEDKNLN